MTKEAVRSTRVAAQTPPKPPAPSALSSAREKLRSALSSRDNLLASLDEVHTAIARLDAAVTAEIAAKNRVAEIEAKGIEAAGDWARRPDRGGTSEVDLPFEELAQARRDLATATGIAAAARAARKKLEAERQNVLRSHRSVSIDVVESLRGVLRETAADIKAECSQHRMKVATCVENLRALASGFRRLPHPDEQHNEGAVIFSEEVRHFLSAPAAAASDASGAREQAAVAFVERLASDPEARFEVRNS